MRKKKLDAKSDPKMGIYPLIIHSDLDSEDESHNFHTATYSELNFEEEIIKL